MEPRRSARLTTYDSNGRDALARDLGWTRGQFEIWMTSSTVRPHLQAWYHLCIEGERRFNDAIEWINMGQKGYYYDPRDLEEDVILACLGEGTSADEANGGSMGFDLEDVQTGEWLTQELWARTAWRIVQANIGSGQVFEHRIDQHAAFCYAFAIDMLCIAFHSIAFRSSASCYHDLIIGSTRKEKAQWTAGRAVWMEKHGEEDSQVESVRSSHSVTSFDDSHGSESDGSEHRGSEELDASSLSTMEELNTGMSRTLAALRLQEKHNVKAVSKGKAVPLTLTGLKKHMVAAAKKKTSSKQAVGTWLSKVDKVYDVDNQEVAFSADEAETPDVAMSEASTIVLRSKKRIASGEEIEGENIVVASVQKRVKLADMDIEVVREHQKDADLQLATPGGEQGRRLRRRVQPASKGALISPESMKGCRGRR